MSRKSKTVELTAADVAGIAQSIDSTCEAIEALQEAVQNQAVEDAAIKTHLDNVLGQLKVVSRTLNGDQGLVSRMAVVEATLRRYEQKMDSFASRSEVASLQSALNDINQDLRKQERKQFDAVTTQIQEEEKSKTGKTANYIAALALVVALAAVLLQNCSFKKQAPSSTSQTKATQSAGK